ncbi:hypothetical protein KPATCC21470_0129 [Kitasatospora purpeofusca]
MVTAVKSVHNCQEPSARQAFATADILERAWVQRNDNPLTGFGRQVDTSEPPPASCSTGQGAELVGEEDRTWAGLLLVRTGGGRMRPAMAWVVR